MLDYFLQSYNENPYDPLVCLCLAQAYLGRSMQRQSDNRLHQITTVRPPPYGSDDDMLMISLQAMAFMSRYRKLMQNNVTYLEPAEIAEEVDYNFGRAFHGLGERVILFLNRLGLIQMMLRYHALGCETLSTDP